MVKVHKPKHLIKSKPGKASAKPGKTINIAVANDVKDKKQKLNITKNKKKDIEVAETPKPLVLAPIESPTPVKPPKTKKISAIEKPIDPKDESKKLVKEQQKSETKSKTKKVENKTEKLLKGKTMIHEAVAVDEADFDAIVNQDNIEKVLKALKALVEKQMSTKKTSIFGDYNYCLNVCCFKIPNCPKRVYKLKLKHPMVDLAIDDVLIIVPDLQRGSKVEYDSTIEHYTDLFREAGVEGLTIMPFNQLKNEYKAFEAKRKLANTYDYYLCDGRIIGHVNGFCGTAFQKPRTTFHSVRMTAAKGLKLEIEKALRKTAYKYLQKGDLISIPVGTDKHSSEQVAENIIKVISELKASYPGGLENIRGLDVKINITGTSSLPIYVSTAIGPNEVPNVIGPREQRILKLKKETNEVLSKFALTKDAEMLKLTKTQIDRKRKFREMQEALTGDENKVIEPIKEDTSDTKVHNKEIPKKKLRKTLKGDENKKAK